jgi:hypothetical protein
MCPGSAANHEGVVRPLVGGIGAAHFDVFGGTLGWFCRSTDRQSGDSTIFVLSNNHVFADTNLAAIGDAIHQPALSEFPSAERIARLHRFVKLRKSGGHNRVDAAIAAIHPDVPYRAVIAGIGSITGTDQVGADDTVLKCGRATGVTFGVVVDNSLSTKIILGDEEPYTYRFKDLFAVKSVGSDFVGPGDSGALVVIGQRAVGLVLARAKTESGGIYGLCCHIDNVMEELQIELVFD